jgi:hypothetical protein
MGLISGLLGPQAEVLFYGLRKAEAAVRRFVTERNELTRL